MVNYPRGSGRRMNAIPVPKINAVGGPETDGGCQQSQKGVGRLRATETCPENGIPDLGDTVANALASATLPGELRPLLKYGPQATPDMFLGVLRSEEDRIQAAFFTRCKFRALSDPRFGMVFAIPNGQGYLSPKERQKMTLTGRVSGVPDIFVAVPCERFTKPYHGFFIEVKTEKGEMSPNQLAWRNRLIEQGYCAVTSFGFGDLWVNILWYFGLTD